MGTKMGPSYANLCVGVIEEQFFDKFAAEKTLTISSHRLIVFTRL